MSQIIDGKMVAESMKIAIGEEVKEMVAAGQKAPHLVAILVGNNGASETYVANKVKSCEELGFASTLLRFDPSISESDLLAEVQKVNDNPDMDGLIVQLPLPAHINPDKVMETIHPSKDVDGFHPINIGRMAKGLPAYISATPQGVLDLLAYYKIETGGKHCVVVGSTKPFGRSKTKSKCYLHWEDHPHKPERNGKPVSSLLIKVTLENLNNINIYEL